MSESTSTPRGAIDAHGGAPGPAPSASVPPAPRERPQHDARAVLRNQSFRRLWAVLGVSSLGDWLGLLATTGLAASLAGLGEGDIAAANLAVAGVIILRLAPAIVLGPLAGVVADRLDRRATLVVGDVVRGALFVSIPLVGTLWWLLVATVLIEITALFWQPAKDALLPNLVPRRQLETANQLNAAATYGSAPIAAAVFVLLVFLSGILDDLTGVLADPAYLALYVNGITFLVAAAVIARLPLPPGVEAAAQTRRSGLAPSVVGQIIEGWRYIAERREIRGLVFGMVGAFAAGGFVMGLGVTYVAGLGAGLPGYGVLVGAIFLGMGLGVWLGPRMLIDVSRRRLFGLAIGTAGACLVLVGLSPSIAVSAVAVTGLGYFAGVAWVTGITLLGGEVEDRVRGRTFAFVQSAVRVVLVGVMAAGPALAALLGTGFELTITPALSWTFAGAGLVLVGAGLLALLIGWLTYRAMDDHPEASLRTELARSLRRTGTDPFDRPRPYPGFFIAVEGGDGAGKSTLVRRLRQWLVEAFGHEVVRTREPGGTELGDVLRDVLLAPPGEGPDPTPRSETLLFAADRAQHVDTVVRPALQAGAVVISDRFADSSVAYQGARQALDPDEIAEVSDWASCGLRPDLTIVLDVPPEVARARRSDRTGVEDRIEGESSEFQASVRQAFLDLAARAPGRYLVVDASLPEEKVVAKAVARLKEMLPLSERQSQLRRERLAQDLTNLRRRESAVIANYEAEEYARQQAAAQAVAADVREGRRTATEIIQQPGGWPVSASVSGVAAGAPGSPGTPPETDILGAGGADGFGWSESAEVAPPAPAAPVGYGPPAAPAAPAAPAGPVAPATPVAPDAPATPVAPVAPTAPAPPLDQTAPAAPAPPVAQTEPIPPVRPAVRPEAAAPTEPISPVRRAVRPEAAAPTEPIPPVPAAPPAPAQPAEPTESVPPVAPTGPGRTNRPGQTPWSGPTARESSAAERPADSDGQ